MCDPITLLMGAMSAVGGLASAMQKPPEPPKAIIPAIAPADNRNPAATVRIGQKDDTNTDANSPNAQLGIEDKRTSGKALAITPLGKSSLSI